MSNNFYSSKAVDSLIGYVLDVKPYHSKLSEIIEEYQFFDDMNVEIDDSRHMTQARIAGIWNSETYSNGLNPILSDLPFIKQAKSAFYWNNNVRISANNIDNQIIGLNSAYYIRHNIGLRRAILNRRSQIEGIDFHVTHGAFSLLIDANTQFGNDVLTPNKFESTALSYPNVASTNGVASEIAANELAEAYEEWTVTCVSAPPNQNEKVVYDHVQTVPATVWNVQHKLGSVDVFVQAFTQNDDYTSTFTPISPSDIEYLDDNTINVVFSSARVGAVKVVKFIEYSPQMMGFVQDTPSDRWVVSHYLNSKNLIPNVKVFIDGALKTIVPNEINLIDLDTVEIVFSKAYSGRLILGKTEAFSSRTFYQTAPQTTWSFENTLKAETGIFTVYLDDDKIIFPQDIKVTKNLIFVTFSSPRSGRLEFTKVFSSNHENTFFSVVGSESGHIGLARAGLRFISSKISFTIIPHQQDSAFYVGETFVLTPDNRIVSHKINAVDEVWSLIKVNPIAFKKPTFIKADGAFIDNFTILKASIRPQTITATYDGSQFNVESNLDGLIGSFAFDQEVKTSEFSFSISPAAIAPVNGDFFEFDVVNESPYVTNLDFTIGYDMTDYDTTEYDDRFINFDLDRLKLKIINMGIAPGYFEFEYNGNGQFSAKKFNNRDDRILQKTYTNIVIGESYQNADFSVEIPDDVSYITGDLFIFDVKNPAPYVDEETLHIQSNDFGYLSLYPKSFIRSPAQRWAIEFTSASNFTVTGSVTGLTTSGTVGQSFDNGFIHFTIFSSNTDFVAGDKFLVYINADKPSYLVHGSITGFTEPAVVGKWYWNGKIGFKLEKPTYKLLEFTTTGPRSTRILTTGSVTLNDGGATITFNRAPRYDAKRTVLEIKKGQTYGGKQYFNVTSSIDGQVHSATLNERYFGIFKPEQSINDVLFNDAEHDGLVDFTIRDPGNTLSDDFSFKVEISSPRFEMSYANDLIILNEPLQSSDIFDAERMAVDKIFLETTSPINKKALLGMDPNGDARQWMPVYVKQSKNFSDLNSVIEIYAAEINKKVGEVQNFGAPGAAQYRLAVDEDFFFEFLPFNSLIASKVIQSEQENAIVKARFSERISFIDKISFKDSVDIVLSDSHFITINTANPIFNEFFNVVVDDTTFRGFMNGYDIFPYDEEPNNYDDSTSTQFSAFTSSAGGIGYQFKETVSSQNTNSKLSENMIIYTRLEDSVFGWQVAAAYDGKSTTVNGWTSATVTDGLPPDNGNGWQNALFGIEYDVTPLSNTDATFSATVSTSSLSLPKPGSALYQSPYVNVNCASFEFIRKVSEIIIMKRGISFNSAVFYQDLSTQSQVAISVLENNSDYMKVSLSQASIGTLVIF